MDDLIEILLDLIIDGSIELLPNKRVPKLIRIIIVLLLFSIIIGIIALGIIILKSSILGGIITILLGVILLIGMIIKIRKYMKE